MLTCHPQRLAAQAPTADADALLSALLVAEDARVNEASHRDTVRTALADRSAQVRLLAVRAIGRTRRAEFLPPTAAALQDASIDVRREAAFAVAHIGSEGGDAFPAAAESLRAALAREADGLVVTSLVEGYGRLPFADAAAIDQAAATVQASVARLSSGGGLLALGAARAAESLARRASQLQVAPPALRRWLESLHATGLPVAPQKRPDAVAGRIRRLAVMGLLSLDAASPEVTRAALADPDAQVRRLGVLALSRHPTADDDGAAQLLDTSVLVRQAAVSRLGPRSAQLAGAALGDTHIHVRLAAIDVLGGQRACREACAAPLGRPGAFSVDWHEAAHALVAVARTSPGEARSHVTTASRADVWQVRMYAARAAAFTGQADVLQVLAVDPHVNVRHAALLAWREAGYPGLVEPAVAALASDDGQLLIEAAAALKGMTLKAPQVQALCEAFLRVTAQGRDTSRDPRIALLERIDEHAAGRGIVRGALADFDPAVAARAAVLVNARLAPGQPAVSAAPVEHGARARVRVPTWREAGELEKTAITITLAGGRTLSLRLFPQVAPAAAARLVDQVRAGEWKGRTFHRVEPGFVVQGGSPAANEYAGADAFARDEFSSLSHVRGTVGISTRGADTGDGQLFINLVDNARLDFAYTVVGAVTGDLSLLDDLREGEPILGAVVAVP